jgi:hypothetical protein
MKHLLFLSLFYITGQAAFSQALNEKGKIGITLPVIYNYSTGAYYQTGNRKEPGGGAFSYGINLSYIQPVYKNIFIKAGVGFFKQNFRVNRPFKFDDPSALLFYTKSYSYVNIDWHAGIGIKRKLGNQTKIEIIGSYMSLHSIKQYYTPTYLSLYSPQNRQTSAKYFRLGYNLNLELGVTRNISEKISLGSHLFFPFIVHWNSDPIFINTYYSTDEQKIAKNKFSAGLSISAYYHF